MPGASSSPPLYIGYVRGGRGCWGLEAGVMAEAGVELACLFGGDDGGGGWQGWRV